MKFLSVDQKGQVLQSGGEPLEDLDFAKGIILNTNLEPSLAYSCEFGEDKYYIEPISTLYIAEKIISLKSGLLKVQIQYDLILELDLEKIFLDYKDRFIIYSKNKNIPCLLSSNAQDELFNLADSYTDESIEFENINYKTPSWIGSNQQISESRFWSDHYNSDQKPWDLGEVSSSLHWAVQKIKLPKQRIAVLGSGAGHDASYLSQLGHTVTGFDFSEEALKEAKTRYGENQNLKWVKENIFDLAEKFRDQFDLVVEHTCFCAIEPERRDELIKVWSSILTEKGQLLGIFFVMPKVSGPPFGATELEVKERLEKFKFRFDLWKRSQFSVEKRLGKELIVLATKKS